jgi:hypothetical protein
MLSRFKNRATGSALLIFRRPELRYFLTKNAALLVIMAPPPIATVPAGAFPAIIEAPWRLSSRSMISSIAQKRL